MPRTRRNANGIIISTLMLDLMRTAVEIFLQEKVVTPYIDDALLCTAMFVGQAEGRLMTSGKIAQYIGMPRASAERKLKSLQDRGLVEQIPNRKWRIPLDRPEIDERVTACTDAQVSNVRRAAAKMAALDARKA